jgi:hypothetical protein
MILMGSSGRLDFVLNKAPEFRFLDTGASARGNTGNAKEFGMKKMNLEKWQPAVWVGNDKPPVLEIPVKMWRLDTA